MGGGVKGRRLRGYNLWVSITISRRVCKGCQIRQTASKFKMQFLGCWGGGSANFRQCEFSSALINRVPNLCRTLWGTEYTGGIFIAIFYLRSANVLRIAF